ncbi:MAG TPA: hypothetical protein VN786_01570 [Acidimicrobiales bacterium]|nr:hypothetical protein [Acidimicrobiales bacterium]
MNARWARCSFWALVVGGHLVETLRAPAAERPLGSAEQDQLTGTSATASARRPASR